MKKRIIWLTLLFIVVFFASALITIHLTGSAPMRLLKVEWYGNIYQDLPYENENGHCYDLYIPDDLQGTSQNLILYIHGGSFNSGAKEDGDAWCTFYASKGYITATLDYSLYGVHDNANLHTMSDQVIACVSAIQKQCEELGYSLQRMAVCGVSAGGTLAMNYAYKCADASAVPVAFVFQLAGPTEFTPADWGLLKQVNGWEDDAAFVRNMTGEDFFHADWIKAICEISPARQVNKNSVPTLLGYGLRDHVVPANQKDILLKALEYHQVPHDYVAFPNSNHGMYADLGRLQDFIELSMMYCELYF